MPQNIEVSDAAPSVIAYSEVYNAIQTGVIDAAENEAAGIEQMKFYEVGPDISLTKHAITVRPIAFSSLKTCFAISSSRPCGQPPYM